MSAEIDQAVAIRPVRRVQANGTWLMLAPLASSWQGCLRWLRVAFRSDRCHCAQAREVSTTIVDRHGKLLRAYAMADGRWRLPVHAATDVDPTYLKLLFAYEDRRFYSHGGVDLLALGRAAFQLVTRGHIVSGGSTITMQLARLMEPRRQRSISAKLRQIVRAIEIERQMSKEQILDLYLAMAPYGGNLEGIRAASIAYFGKEPKRLVVVGGRTTGRHAAIAGKSQARPLSERRARRTRPRARSHGRRRRCSPMPMQRLQRLCPCPACASRCRSWRRIRPTRRCCR